MAYSNLSVAWACDPILVHKKGPSKYMFTVDLRPINRITVKHQFPMPNIEQELIKTAQSAYFTVFDLSHGYWQPILPKKSQERQSFVTPDGIFMPTRVLHGTSKAAMYSQSTMAAFLPKTLRKNLLWWLNDILIHSTTIENHLFAIRSFLEFCVANNLKFHHSKCTLFAVPISWCGCLITK